jgi:2,4-dienoyl-CoA reductase-like NADH-dependent reductase (Old Yellow Enzyme family)
MSCLQPAAIGKLKLRNRLVVAAMSRMQANGDGTVTPQMRAYYANYARHGAGLVMTEALYTDELGARAYFNQPGLANDAQASGWARICEAVHCEGGVLFAQLQHGGRLAEPGLNPVHLAASDGTAAGNTWQRGVPNAPARAAAHAEIEAVVEGFALAARRALAAGFDGVEIHGARGYLLDDFLSASSNRRSDDYGGSLERRLALPLRVVRAVRAELGKLALSYNLSLYKMDDNSYQPPGGADEVRAIARALCEAGADLVHVTTRKALRPEPWGEPLVRTVREAIPNALVIANGGLKTLQDCEQALADSGADLVSMARVFLANPDVIARTAAGLPLAAYAPGMERQALLTASA